MTVELRITAEEQDVEEFAEFIKGLSSIKIKSESGKYPNRRSIEVRKYVKIEYIPLSKERKGSFKPKELEDYTGTFMENILADKKTDKQ